MAVRTIDSSSSTGSPRNSRAVSVHVHVRDPHPLCMQMAICIHIQIRNRPFVFLELEGMQMTLFFIQLVTRARVITMMKVRVEVNIASLVVQQLRGGIRRNTNHVRAHERRRVRRRTSTGTGVGIFPRCVAGGTREPFPLLHKQLQVQPSASQ